DRLPFGGFGRFALRAQSDIGGRVAALSNVNVELDGNSAEGALTISADPRRLVQGTLATDTLDLTPYVSGIRLLARNERNWNQLPITLDGFNDLSLDLRLSAANIKISTARLGRTAVAAALTGINIEQLLRRLERRPLSGIGDLRSGRTPFDQLAINLKVSQGLVSIDEMRVVGPSVRVGVIGQASVPTRDLDLKGVATLIST